MPHWHDLANTPTDPSAGAVVIQSGLAVADQLHAMSSAVAGQWDSSEDALADVVSQVNQAAKDLADINQKISTGLAAGRPVNELQDQRDLLTRTLAKLVGGVATVDSDGQASVSVGGVALVTGSNAQQFALSGAATIGGAAASPPRIVWGTTTVPVESGSAAGYLAVLGTDLPTLSAQLDTVAVSLRDMVNNVHQTGYQADGTPAGVFFDGTDAASFTVVPTDPAQLAVTAVSGAVDGSVAQQLGDLSDERVQATVLGGTGPSAQWRTMTTGLGVRVQSLKNASTVQDSVVAAAEAAVQTDAGVNLDEEMTNLLQYQRSYQASSRLDLRHRRHPRHVDQQDRDRVSVMTARVTQGLDHRGVAARPASGPRPGPGRPGAALQRQADQRPQRRPVGHGLGHDPAVAAGRRRPVPAQHRYGERPAQRHRQHA